jgi:hypothetical protein
MASQSYASHRQYVPLYHYYTGAVLLVLLVWAVYRAVQGFSVDRLMMVLLIVTLILVYYFARAFALRAQDRVIRLEEQLRLARLLPDPLKARLGELSIGQLIALRFAPDAEVPELVAAVLERRIGSVDEIKRSIKAWRIDEARL